MVASIVAAAAFAAIVVSGPAVAESAVPGRGNDSAPTSTTGTEPVRSVDHVITTALQNGQLVQYGRTNRASRAGRLVLVGDSITAGLCPELPTAACFAFPGAWVADINGANLVDRFVTEAALGPNDTVVLSSIGGWHSPGVDDAVILARLQALYVRIARAVHRLVVLVAPFPNFTLCTNPTTPEAKALLGTRHDAACATQLAIAQLERAWPVTTVPIIGPYVSDEEHETSGARSELAQAIVYLL